MFGSPFAVYNLHLESRASNDIRLSQLAEAVDDTQRYVPRVLTLVAGDLSCDRADASPAIVVRRGSGRGTRSTRDDASGVQDDQCTRWTAAGPLVQDSPFL